MLGTTVAGEAQFGGGRDYGIIGEGAAGLTPQPSIYTWNFGTGAPLSSTPQSITGATVAITGSNLCKSGSTSGWTCGQILDVDTSIQVSGQTVNSIVASTCLLPGDSGGGAVVGANAVGIDSGSDFPTDDCTNPGGTTYESVFFPMLSAAGTNSVLGQQSGHWELAVPVTGTPANITVTPSSGTTIDTYSVMSGTLSGATSNSTVLLYLDGSTTPFARASASSGSWSIPLSGMSVGTHTYSLAAGLGWSPSPTPATGTFVFSANTPPIGVIDSATTGPGTISVLGWAYDPGTTGPIQVGVTLDGTAQAAVTANTVKAGFNASFPGYGDNHGFA
ncbi:MAG: LytC, partial [Verrucomicrobiales bacterium]|nr:LytC [Verrucomicrobiales bacterium]